MKTIAERAEEAGIICQYKSDYRYDKRSVESGYTQGATEQKAIDEEVRLKKCDDMTKVEYEREVAFAEWYNKNGKGTPTFSDAIEWARRELIDEACDILSDLGVFDWMASDDPEGFSSGVHKDQFVKCLTEED